MLLGIAPNPGGWSIHLYVNLYSPTPQDLVSNYVETTLPGYSPITFVPGEWSGGIQPGVVADYTYPKITWVFDPYTTAQQTIFGYWVQDLSGRRSMRSCFLAFPRSPGGW